MIPDEAVELALIANWDTEGDQKERMRAALEAAAPHMLAGGVAARADLYEIISHSFYNEHMDPSGHTADAIIAAGYRKVTP